MPFLGELSVGRIPIVGVGPALEQGRWPARAVVGEAVPIWATIFREGHDAEGATVVVTRPDGKREALPMPCVDWGNSRYEVAWIPTIEGPHTFRVEAWSDPYTSWAQAAEVKVKAGVDVQLMLEEGVIVLKRALAEVRRTAFGKATLTEAIEALEDTSRSPDERLAPAIADAVVAETTARPLREWVSTLR